MKKANSITLRIKNTQGQTIVGILERKFDKVNRNKLGIVCHGTLGKLVSNSNILIYIIYKINHSYIFILYWMKYRS